MKKSLLALFLAALMIFAVGCGATNTESKTDADNTKASDLKIGVILVGDETEGYTLAHMDGIKAAANELGIDPDKDIIWKKKVDESDACYNAAKELVASGCKLIVSNSYGHQDYMAQAAEDFKDVNFVSMTGDYAAISGCDNFFNAFTRVYESRYVSGVVAGMKLAQLIKDGKLSDANYNGSNIKIGYVGAFPYAEVVSGYTAFFLGIKSVVENVEMEVYYTSSWFDIEKEAAAAENLMADGCVIIGQHADSTGAPTAIQAALDSGKTAYSVGYNVSMLDVAKDAALTSATNTWSVYYKELFEAAKDGKDIPQDWAKGFDDEAVAITELGASCAEGTKEKVEEVEKAIKDGTLKVFDTSKFTVDGKSVTTAPVDLSYIDFTTNTVVHQGKTVEPIKTENGITFFDESSFRSAPYFSLRIDGIKELNS